MPISAAALIADTDTWTTYTRACSRYGVSLRTLQRLCDRGEVKRVRVPHRRPSVFLSVADLQRVFTPVEDTTAAAEFFAPRRVEVEKP